MKWSIFLFLGMHFSSLRLVFPSLFLSVFASLATDLRQNPTIVATDLKQILEYVATDLRQNYCNFAHELNQRYV